VNNEEGLEEEIEDGSEAEDIFEAAQSMTEETSIYLSGPIRCADDNGVGWRKEVIEEYPNLEFNNPLDNYSPETDEVLSDPAHLDEESERRQVLPCEYVADDKILINKSDVFLLGISNVIARGSMMEAMYARLSGKSIFVWVIDGQLESGWIAHHAEYIDSDRERVMNEVKRCVQDNE